MIKPKAKAFMCPNGIQDAWRAASFFAGPGGRVATLPDVARMRSKLGKNSNMWKRDYTSSSAEYYGLGSDGRQKLIVAHGVGPMSDYTGVMGAYKWGWGDNARCHHGGRIPASDFLRLEAGRYGKTKVVDPGYYAEASDYELVKTGPFSAPISVLDIQDYMDYCVAAGRDAVFDVALTAEEALRDPLLRMRLGKHGSDYIMRQNQMARKACDCAHPKITTVSQSYNVSYVEMDLDERVFKPASTEPEWAVAHLLDMSHLSLSDSREYGPGLFSHSYPHEYWYDARMIGVPDGSRMKDGATEDLDPYFMIRSDWERFMRPVSKDIEPILPYRIELVNGEWFTRYPKASPEEACMDSGDLQYRVRSVRPVGTGRFEVKEMFFLRYPISAVREIAPDGANAYEIVRVGSKGGDGVTPVTVQFYEADVDISCSLPRADELESARIREWTKR
ncbi:hypothetical protein QQ965_03195 [Candidatus Saccharibacteria bacterium oral taxon 955]